MVVPNEKIFDCINQNITKLDISQCPDLEELYCSENAFTSIDLSKCPQLKIFECNYNNLTSIDFSQCPNLEEITLMKHKIRHFKISGLEHLKHLCFGVNTSCVDIVIEKCPVLEELILDGNEMLETLEWSDLPELKYLMCSFCNLRELDVSVFPKLKLLECSKNKLTDLNLNELYDLEHLNCSNNELEELNIQNNEKLTTVISKKNPLPNHIDIDRNVGDYRNWCKDNFTATNQYFLK